MPKTQSWGRGPLSLENPEFEARVKATVGSPYTAAVDKSRATQYPWDLAGLLGFYTIPTATKFRGSEYEYLREAGIKPEADRVYAGKSATAQTWAHEFRHRGSPYGEMENRLRDVYYAGSLPQWDEAIQSIAEYKNLPTEEAEKYVVGLLTPALPPSREEMKNADATGQNPYSISSRVKGIFDPEWLEAARQVNAPWKIWAAKKGLLD